MSGTAPMAQHHRRAVALVITTTLVVLALVTGTLVAVFYKHLDANIRAGQDIKHLAKKRQQGPKTPLNILVMGLDTRDCAGCHVDNEPGGDGSDTTILLHISADRQTVYGVSIPRDLLVKPVACTADHHYYAHGVDTGQVEWNAAFTAGGAACTAEQLEKNFGVYVDSYLTINFGGFKGMVNAIGGVDVCIPFELSDPTYAKVTFEPGNPVHLNGDRALAYVRLRHVLDGSDTGRMKRQQAFISALVNQAESAHTLANPLKVAKFANAFTDSITASPGLASVKKLADLAEQLKHTDVSNIRFITLPSAPYDVPQTDPRWGRVHLLPSAKKLWGHVMNDEPLSRSLSSGSISAGDVPGSASASPTPTGSATGSATGTATGTPTSTPSGTSSAGGSSSSGSSDQESAQESAQEAARYGLCG